MTTPEKSQKDEWRTTRTIKLGFCAKCNTSVAEERCITRRDIMTEVYVFSPVSSPLTTNRPPLSAYASIRLRYVFYQNSCVNNLQTYSPPSNKIGLSVGLD